MESRDTVLWRSQLDAGTLGGPMERPRDFSILPEDLDRIRAAVAIWKGAELARTFSGARVAHYAEAWSTFVETDWASWDRSEYDHDLGCRYWLQVILEHGDSSTRARLETAIRSSDDVFRARMRPQSRPEKAHVPVLCEHPYFWETHTIHPEL